MNDKPYGIAKLVGYNQFDHVVYSALLPLHEYYEGELQWDGEDRVLKLRMTKLCGTMFDGAGNFIQEFESAFCGKTGAYLGGRAKFDDGTTQMDGPYAEIHRKT